MGHCKILPQFRGIGDSSASCGIAQTVRNLTGDSEYTITRDNGTDIELFLVGVSLIWNQEFTPEYVVCVQN